MQTLVAELLSVHALSPAIRYEARQALAVDEHEWWKEVEARGVAAAARAARASKSRPRQTDAAEAQEPDASVEALGIVLQSLDRVNRKRRRTLSDQDDAKPEHDGEQTALREPVLDTDSLLQLLQAADGAIGYAGASALRKLFHEFTSKQRLRPYRGPPVDLAAAKMINLVLQQCGVGSLHAFHQHVLIASIPRRSFPGKKSWECSICSRTSATSLPDGQAPPVYRCSACDFNLCRECFTRVPNAAYFRPDGSSVEMSRAQHGSRADHLQLDVSRIFSLSLPSLQTQSTPEFRVISTKLIMELRRRMLEVYPHQSSTLAPYIGLFAEMVRIPSVAYAMVSSSELPWFPPFSRTWTMSLHTVLGPFLRVTTMLKNAQDIDAALQAKSSPRHRLRAKWQSGYHDVRRQLHGVMRALLDPHLQHPLVIDATLCWIGLTLLAADIRRRMNYDTKERMDGFLINLSSMLVAVAMPVLQQAETNPEVLDVNYHQVVESVRAYASKDFPEAPLRSMMNGDEEGEILLRKARQNEEVARIQECDRQHILRYRNAKQQTAGAAETATDSAYYPRMSCHEGVVCDRCETHNIEGIRYKCALCGDMDLCSTCFAEFLIQYPATATDNSASVSLEPMTDVMAHHRNHLFLRVDVPVPIFAIRHFRPLKLDLDDIRRDEDLENPGATPDEALACSDCGTSLADAEMVYKCSNCFDARFVCAGCLAAEEKCHNPHLMHAPGHLYFAVPKPWRRAFLLDSDSAPALLFRSLLHPPALISRLKFDTSTELFHMAIKSLHFGPLNTLSRWTSAFKEARELQAFCACEEERLEYERALHDQERGTNSQGSRRRRSHKFSSHYTASKARFEELNTKVGKMELHLLDSVHVTEWLVFYSRACRWLLSTASTSQDPFVDVLSSFSAAFSAFPEHFFFDLCDATFFLALDRVDYHEVVGVLKDEYAIDLDEDGGRSSALVIEPIVVVLTQLIIARGCTKNPHLRLEALRSLVAVLTFFAKSKRNRVVERLFERNQLLRKSLARGLLQFHHEMDMYNCSNNGLAFNSAVSSGDHVLWGFLPTRISVVLLLRFLWQLPSQRHVLVELAMATAAPHTAPRSPSHAITGHFGANEIDAINQEWTGLVTGLWSDLAKLFDEGTTKISILRQMSELIASALDGQVLVVPFRPAMLDGYIAIHSKHLRLTLRALIELLELTSWLADSLSLRRFALLKPELVEQGARTICFLLSSLAQAFDGDEWAFSRPLIEDGKAMLANLVMLVVRCAGAHVISDDCRCSPSSFWKVIHASGDAAGARIGDVDALARWNLNAVCTRLESDRYLDGSDDEENDDTSTTNDSSSHETDGGDSNDLGAAATCVDELNEDDALAILEQQAAATKTKKTTAASESSRASRALAKRFIAMLARDGRFDFDKFSHSTLHLRAAGSSSEASNFFEHVDPSWVQQFQGVLKEARDMIELQEAVEQFLGEIPEQYLDPLLSTLMTDPVRLPSGNIVDRAVIERHLLASQSSGAGSSNGSGISGVDPFTREPLTLEMLEPCDALKREIRLYLRTKLRNFQQPSRQEDVLATWGLGWDYLFDADATGGGGGAADGGEDGEKEAASA